MLRCKIDDYKVKPVWVYRAEWKRKVIVPYVSLFCNGALVWHGPSISVTHYLHECKRFLGAPPWREPISIELRCVGVDGDYIRWAVC